MRELITQKKDVQFLNDQNIKFVPNIENHPNKSEIRVSWFYFQNFEQKFFAFLETQSLRCLSVSLSSYFATTKYLNERNKNEVKNAFSRERERESELLIDPKIKRRSRLASSPAKREITD